MLVAGGRNWARSGAGQARSWSPKAVQGEFQAASWAKYKERGAQQSYCDKWGSQMCRICEQVLGWVRRTHPTRPPRDPAQPRERAEVVGPPRPLWALTCLQEGRERGKEPPGKVNSVLLGCVLRGVCRQELQLGWSRAASCGHRQVCGQAPAGAGAGELTVAGLGSCRRGAGVLLGDPPQQPLPPGKLASLQWRCGDPYLEGTPPLSRLEGCTLAASTGGHQ